MEDGKMEEWKKGGKSEWRRETETEKPHKVNPELIKYYSWLAPRGAWKIANKNWSHCSQ
jgi:hypothetical protein